MDVSRSDLQRVLRIYQQRIGASDRSPAPVEEHRDENRAGQADSKGDRMDLSSTAKLIVRMQRELTNEPVVRQERVQVLKEQIDAGEFELDPEKTAQSMLEEFYRNVESESAHGGVFDDG